MTSRRKFMSSVAAIFGGFAFPAIARGGSSPEPPHSIADLKAAPACQSSEKHDFVDGAREMILAAYNDSRTRGDGCDKTIGIECPRGSGKDKLAARLCRDFKKVLIIYPTGQLLEVGYARLREEFGDKFYASIVTKKKALVCGRIRLAVNSPALAGEKYDLIIEMEQACSRLGSIGIVYEAKNGYAVFAPAPVPAAEFIVRLHSEQSYNWHITNPHTWTTGAGKVDVRLS